MKQPCEMTVMQVLPAIRSTLARLLMSDHGMNQTQVSQVLGITQAAVSYYSKEKRGDESLLKRYPQVGESIVELGGDMVNGMSPKERQERICKICRNLQNFMLDEPVKE
ncbi:MAG: transcriptional regulator [Thermoplasmata archaeon]